MDRAQCPCCSVSTLCVLAAIVLCRVEFQMFWQACIHTQTRFGVAADTKVNWCQRDKR